MGIAAAWNVGSWMAEIGDGDVGNVVRKEAAGGRAALAVWCLGCRVFTVFLLLAVNRVCAAPPGLRYIPMLVIPFRTHVPGTVLYRTYRTVHYRYCTVGMLRICRARLHFADRLRAGAGRRSGSGWRQGQPPGETFPQFPRNRNRKLEKDFSRLRTQWRIFLSKSRTTSRAPVLT